MTSNRHHPVVQKVASRCCHLGGLTRYYQKAPHRNRTGNLMKQDIPKGNSRGGSRTLESPFKRGSSPPNRNNNRASVICSNENPSILCRLRNQLSATASKSQKRSFHSSSSSKTPRSSMQNYSTVQYICNIPPQYPKYY